MPEYVWMFVQFVGYIVGDETNWTGHCSCCEWNGTDGTVKEGHGPVWVNAAMWHDDAAMWRANHAV